MECGGDLGKAMMALGWGRVSRNTLALGKHRLRVVGGMGRCHGKVKGGLGLGAGDWEYPRGCDGPSSCE